MRLAQRLGRATTSPVDGDRGAFVADSRDDMVSIARRLHQKILDRLDLAKLSQMPVEQLRGRLRATVEQLVAAEGLAMAESERLALADQIVDELVGHGPLEPLLNDPTVSDVLVNGHDRVYVERNGKLELTDVRFRDERHLIHTIQRMVARVGRRIDESSPMVDARLPDGSRVNAIIPPLALDGASLSIRRFGNKQLTGPDLVRAGAMSETMLRYLHAAVRSRCSILVAGGTGAGKTTLLNLLSGYIAKDERIITIEDAAELRLAQPHVVRLESRPPNLEGKGEVTIRDLVKNALRMRPDRIVVGEVRGGEVLDMLQAMNTGHEGSMATIHANSATDAMNRLMTMLGMTGSALTEQTMATMIARAVHVVVHLSRMQDGARRITEIAEVVGLAGTEVQLNTVFRYERSGFHSDGRMIGRHVQVADTTLHDRFRAAGLANGQTSGEIRR
ncbi:MAG: CpaF family protein [Deltaproteobacteria bacterium]|nr:MAG: CpaF family protein [Deltaproteobacteria bacterium]